MKPLTGITSSIAKGESRQIINAYIKKIDTYQAHFKLAEKQVMGLLKRLRAPSVCSH